MATTMNPSVSRPPPTPTCSAADSRPPAPVSSANRTQSSTDAHEIGLHSITAGAVAGATIGSVVPVVGTAFGASVGAGIGFVVGMAAKEVATEQQKRGNNQKDPRYKPLLESDDDEE